MQSHIQVDAREPKDIIDSLIKLGAEVTSLPVGDFVFHAEEKTFIVERKELSDARASIRDGRWRDQKTRIASAQTDDQTIVPILLIEGLGSLAYDWDLFETTGTGISNKAVCHAIVNSIVYDGFYVLQCAKRADVIETLSHLAHITSSTRRPRTVGSTPKQCLGQQIFKNQLMLILGVSESVASHVVALYPTYRTLYEAAQVDKQNAIRSIAVLKKTEARAVGQKVAQRIVESMC